MGAEQELGEDPEWEGKYFGEFRIIIGFKFTLIVGCPNI